VTFDVLEDVRAGFDPLRQEGLSDGAKTGVVTSQSLYIANPAGTDQPFVVRVYPVPE
jgi:hypothetical protein